MVIARLLPGATLSGLLSQLNTVQSKIKADHPGPAIHDSVSGRTMLEDSVQNYKTPLYALLAATVCVLLIACLNVASLLVARTAARSKELAIRAASAAGASDYCLSGSWKVSSCRSQGTAGLFMAWEAYVGWCERART